jgi:3-oxoadipate enol-lactonase
MRLKAREIDFNLKVAGDGLPLVWAHGLICSMRVEDEFGWFRWDEAAKIARIVRYDCRGHGKSGASDNPDDYRWENLARDMLGIADGLGIDSFIAGGPSLGCVTAIHAALLAPGRVRALILANPPCAWETRPKQIRGYKMLSAATRVIGPGGIAMVLRTFGQKLFPEWQREEGTALVNTYADSIASMDRMTLSRAFKGASTCDMPPRTELKKLTMPALILAWENDTGHPMSTALSLKEALPNSTLVVARNFKEVREWPDRVLEFIKKNPPK